MKNLFDIKDKVIVVTGATGVLAGATARYLAECGAKVAFLGRNDEKLAEAVNKVFDLRPAAIIDTLDLRRPIYSQTAAYGHMGRTDIDLPWEHTDKVDALLEAVK